jgi:multiple antibiotic resistance protein
MLEDQNQLATQFFTLWAMLDPISHLSLFLGATAELSSQERRRAALIGVPLAFCILVFFALAGQFLLHAMGISLISFQIAGGIILLVFSLSMVLSDAPNAKSAIGSPTSRALDVAIYPLATPIVAGPGAMLSVIILTDNNRFTFPQQLTTLLVLGAVLGVLLCIFVLGERIGRLLGHGGTSVLRRIMGVILAALSVNLIVTALARWLNLPEI